MAFGSGSTTVAITSIASSFPLFSPGFFFSGSGLLDLAIRPYLESWSNLVPCLPDGPGGFPRPRQNPRPFGGHGYGVLEVRRVAAVCRYCGPLIVEYLHGRPAGVHHRLDGKHHALLQPRALPRRPVVWKLRILVHPRSNAVAHEFPNHRIAVLFDPFLHRCGDISEPVAGPNLLDRVLERLARHLQELFTPRRDFPHRDGQGCIREVALQLDAEIHREDVAFPQPARGRWDAMHHLLIDRGTHGTRVAPIALESRARTMLGRVFLGEHIQLFRRDTGTDHGAHLLQRAPYNQSRAVHLLKLSRRFTDDHRDLPRASKHHPAHGSLLRHSSKHR